MDSSDILKFISYSSRVDPSFWHKLSQIKLDIDKLKENEHKLWGYYSNTSPPALNCCMNVDCSSYNEEPENNSLIVTGSVINKNTIEAFKEVDKIQLLQDKGKELWEIIKNEGLEHTFLINQFFILTFADLKKYHFYYWFAFPALNQVIGCLKSHQSISNVLELEQIKSISEFYIRLPARNKTFFGGLFNGKQWVGREFKDIKEKESEDIIWCFSDPSLDNDYPGWPLRNYLAFISHHFPQVRHTDIKVLGIKCNIHKEFTINIDSQFWIINVQPAEDNQVWVGWERNERGKMGPRMTNLSQSMDPIKLAEASVDLNVKLMKWQIAPDLDLDIIRNTKCLLLGAGTLGCAVARNLLSWGVRYITLVDKGRVSYSNPVRQHLYKFQDSINNGKLKALAAAEALKEIFPGVEAQGLTLSIPMPGHPVGDSLKQEVVEDITTLAELINSHDAIFLLMDSRESRWLPTVMAASNNKITINAALGFDSYLVIRHGVRNDTNTRLGCYFCNDVTAPGNSTKSRTLDQQCTVTRPGVSNIAAALAVELMVSILQHPLQAAAAADEREECILGWIPHSIRGYLNDFKTLLPTTEAFSSCIGCSDIVVQEYKNNFIEFVLKVLDSKEYLEQLTGLSKLLKDCESDDVISLSDSESEEMEN